MAIGVNWSPEAITVVGKLFASTRNLGLFPHMGRMVPELGDDKIREIFVYSYRLIYRVEEKQILIIAVIHGKRLLETHTDRVKAPE